MSTALVSTGVQFPDTTIQTSAGLTGSITSGYSDDNLKTKLGTEIQNLKAAMFNENRKTKRAELQRTIQKLNRQLSKLS